MGVGADNDVRIVVGADNRAAAAFGDAAKGAKTVGDVAQRTGKQLKEMGGKLDEANVKARRLAEAEERAAAKAREMAEKVAILRRQLAESGDSSGALSRKIERLSVDTRTAALAADDYRRAANRASSEAREQARAYDRVAGNAREAARAVALLGAASLLMPGGKGGGGKDGSGWFSQLGDQAMNGLQAPFSATGGLASGVVANPYGLPLAVTGAALAAPAIGANIGGAALLGGAAAGVGLGLAGAWMGDPDKYGARWDTMIDGLKQRWIGATHDFGGPLEDSLDEVDRIFRDLPLDELATASKDFVGPLVQGAGGGITEVADGFADLVAAAKPVVDEVGPKLTNLGHDVGDAMRMIGLGADGGAEALGDLVDAIGYAVKVTGVLIGGFEKAYVVQKDLMTGAYGAATAMPVLGDATEFVIDKLFRIESTSMTAGRSLKGTGDAAADAAGSAAQLSYALDEVRNKQLAMADANIGLAQGWLDLGEELKAGKRTLDLNTQAGIDNQRAIVDQIAEAERLRQQQIALTGDVDAANATYDQNIERIRKMAKDLGFNAAQVDALILSLSGLDGYKAQADVGVAGLSEAKDGVGMLQRMLNNIEGTYRATVSVGYRDAPTRAAGGATSGMSVVNDWGPGTGELIRTPNGSTVIPAGSGRALMRDLATAGGGRSGGEPIQIIISSDGSRTSDLLLDLLAPSVRARGGNVQVAVMGRP